MYCPSCWKQIPENSVSCPHCGEPVDAFASTSAVGEHVSTLSPTPALTEWEYDSFIYHFQSDSIGVPLGLGKYAETEAKRKFWQNSKDRIWMELQRWLDKGWEPMGDVGASCIEIHRYTRFNISDVMRLLISPSDEWGRTYAKPINFRLQFRRLRSKTDHPDQYTRLSVESLRAESERRELESARRELESSFAYQFGHFIRKLFGR